MGQPEKHQNAQQSRMTKGGEDGEAAMSLAERILVDNTRIFMNREHFAEEHTWNNAKFTCVVDEETALKRKNNNVVDVSWDNNLTELVLYTPVEGFPGKRVQPNTMVLFDGKQKKVLQINADGGMYTILLVSQEARSMQQ